MSQYKLKKRVCQIEKCDKVPYDPQHSIYPDYCEDHICIYINYYYNVACRNHRKSSTIVTCEDHTCIFPDCTNSINIKSRYTSFCVDHCKPVSKLSLLLFGVATTIIFLSFTATFS